MRKTLLLSSASLLFATNLLANAANVPAPQTASAAAPCVGCACPDARVNIHTGFYGGVQGGYQRLSTTYRAVFTDRILNPGVYARKATDSAGGFVGDIFLGARMVRQNCMVAGLEVSSLLDSGESDRIVGFGPNNTLNLRFKAKRNFGVVTSGVFGWLLNDRMMVYGKAGLAISRLETRVFDDLAVVPRTTKTESTLFGFAPAIGLEYGFSPRISMRSELGAEFYGKFGREYLIGDVTPINNANVQNSVLLKTRTSMINAKVGVVVKI